MTAHEKERSTGEKVLWWTEIGGIIAAVLGVLHGAAEFALGGTATAAAALGLEKLLYKSKPQTTRV